MAFLPDDNKHEEILSPEGVEERVVRRFECIITNTQGGKFRVYQNSGKKREPISVHDTQPEAEEVAAQLIAMSGHMLIDPKGTIMKILEGIGRDKK